MFSSKIDELLKENYIINILEQRSKWQCSFFDSIQVAIENSLWKDSITYVLYTR